MTQDKDIYNTMKTKRLRIIDFLNKCRKTAERLRHINIIYWIAGIIIILAVFLASMPFSLWEYFAQRLMDQRYFIALISAFCIIAVSLIWKKGQNIDVWVFTIFNTHGRRGSWLDLSMLGITQIGSGAFALGIAIVYFIRVNRPLAYEIILGSLTLWLAVELMKALIRRKRPYVKLNNIRIVGTRAGGHSFPSGHTSQSFFMATLLSNYYGSDLTGALILYIAALLVGITRMYVGMHYPRDVLGGAVLGTVWGLFGVIINSYVTEFASAHVCAL